MSSKSYLDYRLGSFTVTSEEMLKQIPTI